MNPRRLSRRDFLRAAGIGFVATSAGLSVPTLLAQDPTATPLPLPQGAAGKLTVIHRTEYFQVVQQMFRQTVENYAAANGLELDISTANPEVFGDFPAKMLAAVQAGNPPDLGYNQLNIPALISLDILEDVTDVVETLTSRYGATVPVESQFNGMFDGRWYAIPFMSFTGAWFARKDKFEAKGIDVQTLATFDDRREACLEVSNPDENFYGWGMTINRSGDGHGLISGVIQAFGGRFVDDSGFKVIFASPETVAAVEWLVETYTSDRYKPMLPPGIESWTDTSNNEQYLAGTIGMTLNQPSVYAAAKANNNPVFEQTAVMHAPTWNDGTLHEAGGNGWLMIFKGAPNVDVAKDLVYNLLDPANYVPMVQNGGGLFLPAYANLWTDEVLGTDPNFAVFRDILLHEEPYFGQSHPAPPNALVGQIDAASITSQMMVNAISGAMTPEQAVQDAHDKIVQIFEEGGAPQ
ncbi:MAG: extracellular solute-binding protein [Anaerolineae bacterium]|nr:extracellular solute-binding protein [Anaerolineae bacterium]